MACTIEMAEWEWGILSHGTGVPQTRSCSTSRVTEYDGLSDSNGGGAIMAYCGISHTLCWSEGRNATLRSKSPLLSRCSDRQSRQGHPSLDRHQTKTNDEGIPQCGFARLRGPRAIRPIVTGPAQQPRVTGLICKGIPVITVCNPALWEYSGDNLGS
jgi:hypothetical protein